MRRSPTGCTRTWLSVLCRRRLELGQFLTGALRSARLKVGSVEVPLSSSVFSHCFRLSSHLSWFASSFLPLNHRLEYNFEQHRCMWLRLEPDVSPRRAVVTSRILMTGQSLNFGFVGLIGTLSHSSRSARNAAGRLQGTPRLITPPIRPALTPNVLLPSARVGHAHGSFVSTQIIIFYSNNKVPGFQVWVEMLLATWRDTVWLVLLRRTPRSFPSCSSP